MEDRSSHNPSDDLVPLDILRPSREHFGPVTTPSKQVQKQANSKVPAKRPAQRQPSKGQASKKVTDNTPALRRGAPPSGARPVQGRVVNQNRQPAKP